MPLLTLLLQITNMLIYDLDSPEQKRNRFFVIGEAIVWNIGMQGCVQPVLALSVAAVMCPFISLVILAGKIFKMIFGYLPINILIRRNLRRVVINII